MAPQFGTSGLRGLVAELTPAVIADYTRAFLASCPTGGGLHIGWDLRASSPALAEVVAGTALAAGLQVSRAGAVPTPALALAAMAAGQAAVMVTGSHIPADRNGLKFYRPEGEISKADEAAILAALGHPLQAAAPLPERPDPESAAQYKTRYISAFGPKALAGLRIGVWQQSSVIRDLLPEILQALGAEVITFGRAATFLPIDTEALSLETKRLLRRVAREAGGDAIVSADGDADRPLVADAQGRVIAGDRLGPLTATYLGADQVVTPISSNSLVAEMPWQALRRTRIGSPYVISEMSQILAADPKARVIGYEANGGFLLGFTAKAHAGGLLGDLPPLMTRDCLLPILAPLALARAEGVSLAALSESLPQRFTATDRLQEIATSRSRAVLEGLTTREARAELLSAISHEVRGGIGAETGLDQTDGLRISLEGGDLIHLRPSGNAPEFRLYAEGKTAARARALLAAALKVMAQALD